MSEKRPLISVPFLIIVLVLGVGAYLAGPWVMTMVMLQEERAKQSGGPVEPENYAGLSELAKSVNAGASGAEAFGAAGSPDGAPAAPAAEKEAEKEAEAGQTEGGEGEADNESDA